MPEQKRAQLPYGNATTLQGISENFAFHASPQSFITKRVLQVQQADPGVFNSRAVVRAKILNRNIAIVSSHAHIVQILGEYETDEAGTPAFVASAAYDKLMGPFFPTPNLLLSDGEDHRTKRQPWNAHMSGFTTNSKSFIRSTAKSHFESLIDSAAKTDLYVSMKSLAWQVLLGGFLSLTPKDNDFEIIESLQEDLLRGQFSLFPISINLGLWKSAQRVGIDAKEKLQDIIAKHMQLGGGQACPFHVSNPDQQKDIVNHILLYTSSLAAKALASLLTALFLNLFLFPLNEQAHADRSALLDDEDALMQFILEVERLSPPIVGIMRRATRDFILTSNDSNPNVLIPQGWEAWIYFVGGGRDLGMFGADGNNFKPQRYADMSTPAGFAFGSGPKSCLGQDFMRGVLKEIARTCLECEIKISHDGLIADGVQAWLGQNADCSPERWAADMKQLPTQHPREPVLVQFAR